MARRCDDPDWLLGRRFVTDFTVVAVADDPDRTVTLLRACEDGETETYKVALREFATTIERGFVVESVLPGATRH